PIFSSACGNVANIFPPARKSGWPMWEDSAVSGKLSASLRKSEEVMVGVAGGRNRSPALLSYYRGALDGGTIPFKRMYTARYPYSSLLCVIKPHNTANFER